MGDSIAAHFRIPDQWLDANQINEESFKHIAYIFENEIDWPHLSAMTGFYIITILKSISNHNYFSLLGHVQNSWPIIIGNTSSLYLKLWERNKCNFRDYQNLGVNGARTGAMYDDIVHT